MSKFKITNQDGLGSIIVLGVIVLLLVAGAGTYVFLKNQDGAKERPTNSSESADTTPDSSQTKYESEANDAQSITEVIAVHSALESYFNEHALYPTELSTTALTRLKSDYLTDSKGNKYEYTPANCTADGCRGYVLRYKFQNPQYDSIYNKDGYMTRKSLN